MNRTGIGVDRAQHHGPLAEAANGSQQPIEIAGGQHGILAAKVANDVLFRAPALADILHELEVGVAVDGLLAHEHAAHSTASSAPELRNYSTTPFYPPNPHAKFQ
jgi:hypothetical protein